MRAYVDGKYVPLGPPKQRAVLGLLASRVNKPVKVEEIVTAVWGGSVPRTALNGVHTYVAGLRRILEPERGRREAGSVLVSANGAYALRMDAESIDAVLFERGHTRARRMSAEGIAKRALQEYDAALSLWRGSAYANIPGPFADLERMRLHELRLTAAEGWAAAMLATGRHAEVVTGLSGFIAQEPLREKLRWLQMLALYRCGRRANALEAYQETRRLLARELGVEPGVELRRLQEQILTGRSRSGRPPALDTVRNDVRAEPSPRRATAVIVSSGRPEPSREGTRLPPPMPGFLGRERETLQFLDLMAAREAAPADKSTIVVVNGRPGVGKTAMALQLAHTIKRDFADGQFFLDLRGRAGPQQRWSLTDALGSLLRRLGVEESRLPARTAPRLALYRSLMYRKRVVLVLDDAVGAEQVRPLIPHGPNCVLVTSRVRQPGLAARDGAYTLSLTPFAAQESLRVLRSLLGRERVDADVAATLRLAERCGHLPRSLRGLGECLAARPELSMEEAAREHAPRFLAAAVHGTANGTPSWPDSGQRGAHPVLPQHG